MIFSKIHNVKLERPQNIIFRVLWVFVPRTNISVALLGGSPSPLQVSAQITLGPCLGKPPCTMTCYQTPGWHLGPDLTWPTLSPFLGVPCNFCFTKVSKIWNVLTQWTARPCFKGSWILRVGLPGSLKVLKKRNKLILFDSDWAK